MVEPRDEPTPPPIESLRQSFVISDPDVAYLDGNSLGRLPHKAAERIDEVVNVGWGHDLIASWNADWITLPARVASKIAKVIGAAPSEVAVADSTSVNLFKLATAALRYQSSRGETHRTKVITDAGNFPSDFYILESAIEAANAHQQLVKVGSEDQIAIDPNEIISKIDSDTALVCMSHVAFKSGQLHDMQAITAAAQGCGALVLWDLSHSVGAVPIDLQELNVDMAVGCTYKYLCGGPGAPAFLYCREDVLAHVKNPIAGWFAHRAPFEFNLEFTPANGIAKFATGTPPVLSLAAIEAGVDLVLEAGVEQLRARSIELTSRLLEAAQSRLARLGFQLRSPPEPSQRGSHISLGHPEARRITENLICRHKVIPDFRTPDNIRLGVAPLYTTTREIDQAIEALEKTVVDREYETIRLPDSPVT